MEAGLRDQVLWRLLVATALIHLLFAIWPSIDIAASRLFVQADGSFWLAKSKIAEDVRMPIWLASVTLAALAAVMLGISLLRGTKARTAWRLWAFITTLYVLGPGLLVNVLLKQNWGRARPVSVEAFGGDKLFTPPFEIAGQCSNNCSFVSGEAASAAVMVIVLAVLFTSDCQKPWRRVVFVALGALFMLASGMRVASGRHFLSDVVFAGLFMLIIARSLYIAFGVRPVVGRGLFAAIYADVFGAGGSPFKLGSVAVDLPKNGAISVVSQQDKETGTVV
jgi:lipid A 4'-phosphatase